jgi:dolichol kinase
VNPGTEAFIEGFMACFIAGTLFCLLATLLAFKQRTKRIT